MPKFCNKLGFSVEYVFSENYKPNLNSVSCGAVDYEKGDLQIVV